MHTNVDAPESAPPRRVPALLAVLCLCGWIGMSLIAVFLVRPPRPLPVDAPSVAGSAGRAIEVLERLARAPGESRTSPRPMGSEAAERCRGRLEDELRRLGLEPTVQRTLATLPAEGAAGRVANVIATLPGHGHIDGPRSAIVLMAHYDSVPVSPGIGDDLAGVAAILEATRALRERGGLRHDLILLFTDGEERGLLGAEAFAAKHTDRERVGAVINIEGRGASGPSRMFETGPENLPSVASLSRKARRPSASSLSTAIYRRMPNDTDFTVWNQRGVPGLNFAFIGDVHAYHSPVDDIDRLSLASLQHHVTNAVDAVLAFDRIEFESEGLAVNGVPQGGAGAGDAVFFDVAGRHMIHFSAFAARLIGIGLLLGSLFFAAFFGSRKSVRPWRAALAALCVPLTMGAVVLGSFAARAALDAVGVDSVAHPARPFPILVALAATAVLSGTLFARLLGVFLRSAEVLTGALVVLGLASLAVGFGFVAGSYLVYVPAAALLVGSFGAAASKRLDAAAACAGGFAALAAAVLWGPLHVGLTDAFGVRDGVFLGVPLALGFACLVPALVGAASSGALRYVSIALFLIALTSGGLARYLPSVSAVGRGGVNVIQRWTPKGPMLQLSGDPAFVQAVVARVKSAGAGQDGGAGTRGGAAPAAPSAEWLGAGEEGTRVRVLPAPGTSTIVLRCPGAAITLDGARFEYGELEYINPPETGFEIEVDTMGPRGVALTLEGQTFGLGGSGATRNAERYQNARLPDFMPVSRGDRTIVEATYAWGRDGERR